MIGILRILVFAFIGLSVIFLLVQMYSRSVRREKLEKAWDSDPAREGAAKAERDAYIAEGMAAYEHSLRKRLIWLVYILPGVVVAIIIYVVNWN